MMHYPYYHQPSSRRYRPTYQDPTMKTHEVASYPYPTNTYEPSYPGVYDPFLYQKALSQYNAMHPKVATAKNQTPQPSETSTAPETTVNLESPLEKVEVSEQNTNEMVGVPEMTTEEPPDATSNVYVDPTYYLTQPENDPPVQNTVTEPVATEQRMEPVQTHSEQPPTQTMQNMNLRVPVKPKSAPPVTYNHFPPNPISFIPDNSYTLGNLEPYTVLFMNQNNISNTPYAYKEFVYNVYPF